MTYQLCGVEWRDTASPSHYLDLASVACSFSIIFFHHFFLQPTILAHKWKLDGCTHLMLISAQMHANVKNDWLIAILMSIFCAVLLKNLSMEFLFLLLLSRYWHSQPEPPSVQRRYYRGHRQYNDPFVSCFFFFTCLGLLSSWVMSQRTC